MYLGICSKGDAAYYADWKEWKLYPVLLSTRQPDLLTIELNKYRNKRVMVECLISTLTGKKANIRCNRDDFINGFLSIGKRLGFSKVNLHISPIIANKKNIEEAISIINEITQQVEDNINVKLSFFYNTDTVSNRYIAHDLLLVQKDLLVSKKEQEKVIELISKQTNNITIWKREDYSKLITGCTPFITDNDEIELGLHNDYEIIELLSKNKLCTNHCLFCPYNWECIDNTPLGIVKRKAFKIKNHQIEVGE
jgi:hypothetical protein